MDKVLLPRANIIVFDDNCGESDLVIKLSQSNSWKDIRCDSGVFSKDRGRWAFQVRRILWII